MSVTPAYILLAISTCSIITYHSASNTPHNRLFTPTPAIVKLKFTNKKKQHQVPFFLVADFESFLRPITNDDDDDRGTKIVNEHNVSGFCCHRITQLEQYQTSPTVYSGEEVMSKFYEHVTNESKEICKIMTNNVPMEPLTDEEQTKYSRATPFARIASNHLVTIGLTGKFTTTTT